MAPGAGWLAGSSIGCWAPWARSGSLWERKVRSLNTQETLGKGHSPHSLGVSIQVLRAPVRGDRTPLAVAPPAALAQLGLPGGTCGQRWGCQLLTRRPCGLEGGLVTDTRGFCFLLSEGMTLQPSSEGEACPGLPGPGWEGSCCWEALGPAPLRADCERDASAERVSIRRQLRRRFQQWRGRVDSPCWVRTESGRGADRTPRPGRARLNPPPPPTQEPRDPTQPAVAIATPAIATPAPCSPWGSGSAQGKWPWTEPVSCKAWNPVPSFETNKQHSPGLLRHR